MENSDTFDLQLFLPYLLNQAAEESSLSFQRVYKDRYGMLQHAIAVFIDPLKRQATFFGRLIEQIG